MKVAHVNTHTFGGAAIAAIRIHKALLKLGTDSTFISRYGLAGKIPHHFFFKDATFLYKLRKIAADPLVYPFAKFVQGLRPHPNLAGKPESIEVFSPISSVQLSNLDVFAQQDIIHLHWVNDFIAYNRFFNTLSEKKFVWTLHDMDPISGGCHYSDGCEQFMTDCKKCPQLKNTIDENYAASVLNWKIKGLETLSEDQLTVTSPSTWLLELSKKSKVTKRFRHELIYNPTFDSIDGKPMSKENARAELGLPLSDKIILFAADNLKSPRKGIDLLFAALQKLPEKNKILILGIGHKATIPVGLNVQFSGSITKPDVLKAHYYAADYFITPTRAENSPLVVIEALTCGTPVLASRIGGLTDLIDDSNGILFEVGDVEGIANAIRTVVYDEKTFDRAEIRRKAIEKHRSDNVAAMYRSLYLDICKI